MNQNDFICIRLLSELLSDYREKFPQMRFEEKWIGFVILAPTPFLSVLNRERTFIAHHDVARMVSMGIKVPVSFETGYDCVRVNGIRIVPNYEMSLVLYHEDAVCLKNPPVAKINLNERISVIA